MQLCIVVFSLNTNGNEIIDDNNDENDDDNDDDDDYIDDKNRIGTCLCKIRSIL